MKKIVFALLLTIGVLASHNSQAQLAVGLRAGYPVGITLKTNAAGKSSFEFIVGSYGYGNFNLTALYEFQKQIGDIDGLIFYAGPGVHINFQNDIRYYRWYRANARYYEVRYGNGNYVSGGVDAIFGIDYKIPDFPMSIGADLKPVVDIGRYDAAFWIDGALNIRFFL